MEFYSKQWFQKLLLSTIAHGHASIAQTGFINLSATHLLDWMILGGADSPASCRMLGNTPGVPTHEVLGVHFPSRLVMTIKNVPRHGHMSLWGSVELLLVEKQWLSIRCVINETKQAYSGPQERCSFLSFFVSFVSWTLGPKLVTFFFSIFKQILSDMSLSHRL